jgi:hypothetical protein
MKSCFPVRETTVLFSVPLILAMGCQQRATPTTERQEPLPTAEPSAEITWRFVSTFADGRRFVTDNCLLIDVDYLVIDKLPARELPAEKVERLFAHNTTHRFVLTDLKDTGPLGHYRTPTGILLNRRYISYLRGLPMKKVLQFRASGLSDPVLILDGDYTIGALMTMEE